MKSSVLQLVRVFDGEKGKDGASFSIATDYDTILRFVKTYNEESIEWDWSPSTFQLFLLDTEGRPINWTGERYKEADDSFRSSEPPRRIFLTIEANGAVQTNGEAQTSSTVIQVNLHDYFSLSDTGADAFRSVFKLQDSSLSGTEGGTAKNNDLLIFDLEELMRVAQDESLDEIVTLQDLLYSLKSMAQMSHLTLKFTVRIENLKEIATIAEPSEEEDGLLETYNVTAFLAVRAGLNTEMAQFSLNAGSITAAVQKAGLEFNAEGLKVKNGNFAIVDSAGKKVLGADTSGNLSLTGAINALSGKIGGFKITEQYLVSTGGEEDKKVVLNGATGSITAYGLDIKEGEVSGELTIGKTETNPGLVLRAPTYDNNLIAYHGDVFSLNDNGILTVRDAHINGILEASIIQNTTFQKGSISTIDGALILLSNTSNFSIKQPLGQDEDGNFLVTVQPEGEGPWESMELNGEVAFSLANDTIMGTVTDIRANRSEFIIKTTRNPVGAIHLYYLGTGSSTPIIGINGENSDLWNSALPKKALSIFRPGTNLPILLLGDLTPVTGELKDAEGKTLPPRYGLYCDDVILKGSLETSRTSKEGKEVTIAGMDTNVDGDNDIVLWAGQTPTGERAKAPFTVTRDGQVYASRITLEDGVFTNSTIQGGSIKTATVIGAHGNEKGLRFINTGSQGGIGFYNAASEDDISEATLTLGISNTSFYTRGNDLESAADGRYDFIKLGTDAVHFRGTGFKTIKNNQYLILKDNYLGFSVDEGGVLLSSIYLTESGVGIGADKETSAHMYVAQSDTYLNTETVRIKSRVELGGKMMYRQVGGNYMLYVYEEEQE